MKKISINYINFANEVKNLDLHDAELRDVYCSYDKHEIEIPVIIDAPGKRNVKSKMGFFGVCNFSISFLEPWGQGVYINEIKILEGEGEFTKKLCCELLLNSGDKITIISDEIKYLEGI